MRRNAFIATVAFALVSLFSDFAAAADFTVTNQDMSAWLINGAANPALTLHRGQTYRFDVNVDAGAPTIHPFWIKTAQTLGSANAFNEGVTNNGVDVGTLQFSVPADAPANLFYQCGNHTAMTGPITVLAASVPAVGGFTAAALMVAVLGLGFAMLRRRSTSPSLKSIWHLGGRPDLGGERQ